MKDLRNGRATCVSHYPYFGLAVFRQARLLQAQFAGRSSLCLARNVKAILLAIFGVILFQPAQANLVLTAPPRESVERGEELYGPLAHVLSLQLGQTVVYEHPRDWIEYALKMRDNAYDIVFDGPHFAAWRIKHLEHVPVAKLPGDLFFLAVTRYDDKKLVRANDLINTGTPVCGMPSPNLATIAVMKHFTNPIIQPDIYEVPSLNDGYE